MRVDSLGGGHGKAKKFERERVTARQNVRENVGGNVSENVGENVRIRKEDKWNNSKILKKASTPKSYIVKPADGACYSKNYKHNIRKSKELYYTFNPNIKAPSNIGHVNTSVSIATVSTDSQGTC